MNALILALGCVALYVVAYHTYGRYLGKKIFSLHNGRPTPAQRLQDAYDFVPARRHVLFGHHFTSIAGTGPIVGPAIGVIWGWVPALLWVVLGPILIGAVHDMGALIVSVRNDGRSIAEIIGTTISPQIRRLFFILIFFELWIVIALFALIIALLFHMYPRAVLAIWLEIPIAIWLGWRVEKRGASLLRMSVIGIIIMYITVIVGAYLPLTMPALFGINPILIWMIVLFAYGFIASVLPVHRLLQPRDYLNSHQLLIAMGLLAAGLVIARPPMAAPAYVPHPAGAPPLAPFLFVIIACGAVSGFHALVSSGTTSKQLAHETDSLFVGYGSMLFEGGLAVLVILACTAGLGLGVAGSDGALLTGPAAFVNHYSSWAAANGLGAKLGAFIEGSANIFDALAIPRPIGIAIMGVFVVSFASTTLDTATRIQRYVVAELATGANLRPLAKRYPATILAVASAMALAFYTGDGKGAMALWPIFGAVNQLLAGLALLAVTSYLIHTGRPIWITVPPLLFMLIMTSWAMISNGLTLWEKGDLLLAGLSTLILLLQAWMLLASIPILYAKRRTTPRTAAADIADQSTALAPEIESF
jgi:carbon starvation protein